MKRPGSRGAGDYGEDTRHKDEKAGKDAKPSVQSDLMPSMGEEGVRRLQRGPSLEAAPTHVESFTLVPLSLTPPCQLKLADRLGTLHEGEGDEKEGERDPSAGGLEERPVDCGKSRCEKI